MIRDASPNRGPRYVHHFRAEHAYPISESDGGQRAAAGDQRAATDCDQRAVAGAAPFSTSEAYGPYINLPVDEWHGVHQPPPPMNEIRRTACPVGATPALNFGERPRPPGVARPPRSPRALSRPHVQRARGPGAPGPPVRSPRGPPPGGPPPSEGLGSGGARGENPRGGRLSLSPPPRAEAFR